MPQAPDRNEIGLALVSTREQLRGGDAVSRRALDVHSWRCLELAHERVEGGVDTEALDQCLTRGVLVRTVDAAAVDVNQPEGDRL